MKLCIVVVLAVVVPVFGSGKEVLPLDCPGVPRGDEIFNQILMENLPKLKFCCPCYYGNEIQLTQFHEVEVSKSRSDSVNVIAVRNQIKADFVGQNFEDYIAKKIDFACKTKEAKIYCVIRTPRRGVGIGQFRK